MSARVAPQIMLADERSLNRQDAKSAKDLKRLLRLLRVLRSLLSVHTHAGFSLR